jgi:outer membrane protein assembly factor BamA
VYRTSNDVRLPVGYQLNTLPDWWSELKKDYIITASLRYSFPLGYPDWNLSKLLYVRRLKGALFYDFGTVGGKDIDDKGTLKNKYKTALQSYGLEFSGDLNVMRFYAPVDAGVRVGYLPALKKPVVEMILSVDFNSL